MTGKNLLWIALSGLVFSASLALGACSSGENNSPTLESSMPTPSERTYTPAELKKMASNGSYPKQYPPTTQSRKMAFDKCAAKVKAFVDLVKKDYPAEITVDTGIMVYGKAWTNDGALTMACSQPDSTMVITKAKYR
ncbi:MAG: hypothetical protein ABIP56_09155 [Dokdonella sp.]